jgi:hypothetical protein
MIRDLFPEAQATSIGFTQEELRTLFNVPNSLKKNENAKQ